MIKSLFWIGLIAMAISMPASIQAQTPTEFASPIIIAHRGASGERPEHTLEAYQLAIDQGADYIEPDLVFTKDGVLVARHENEISGTTDVAERSEFAARITGKVIDGEEVYGWFTEDFTLAELKTLKADERLQQLRPENAAYDGQFDVPTLAEIIALVRAAEAKTGRRIGLYPELKHPGYFETIGFRPVDSLLAVLRSAGYSGDDPVFIQSFEATPLVQIKFRSDFKGIQLIASEGGPADAPQLSYAQFVQPAGLKQVASYAYGIGADMRLILNDDGTPTDLVANAHAAGMKVHAWTLRRENAFMPDALKSNDNPKGVGGLPPLMGLLVNAKVDGIFTDHPHAAVTLRESGNYEP